MPADALEPVRIPAEFWQRPDVVTALHHRDIGALFHLIRRQTGASQTRIGIAVGLSQGEVSRIMRPGPRQRRVIALDLITRIADGLGMPDTARLDLGLAHHSHPDVAADPIMQPDREDRTGAVAVQTDAASEAAEDVVDVLSRIHRRNRSVDPAIVDHLSDNLSDLVFRYEQLNHKDLIPALRKQRSWIDSLLEECSHPRQRQRLFEIAGGTAGLLGYVAVGSGKFPLARAYCTEAFQLGDFVLNSNLQAWARGLQSFCEYYARNYEESLRLAEDGLVYAKSGPQSVRLTVNGAARAMGKLGDVEGVHRAVGQAHELLSSNKPRSGFPSSIALDCYSPAQTASNAATAYVSLGMPDKVQQYVDVALPEINESESPWTRSLVMIDLAVSMISTKDADRTHVGEVILDALNTSADRPIIAVRQRASEFVRDATRQWGDSKQLDEIRQALSIQEEH